MTELTSYMDHLRTLSENEPRMCLARYYPDVTFHWIGDVGPPPIGKCFNCHSQDCTSQCTWHPDNPDKEERIERAGIAASEKNIQWNSSVDCLSRFMEEQRRKWREWEEKTFAV